MRLRIDKKKAKIKMLCCIIIIIPVQAATIVQPSHLHRQLRGRSLPLERTDKMRIGQAIYKVYIDCSPPARVVGRKRFVKYNMSFGCCGAG
jgi:hypothetical protein